jgi:hypothetical protein
MIIDIMIAANQEIFMMFDFWNECFWEMDLRNEQSKMESIPGYADLNTFADSLVSVMEAKMDERTVE